ncbi:MAG: hypothetical protein IJ608_06010 [Lachnospiraceae bacterium]|nr:hypothetical protein [Lachnospiraceae bacterium]
MNKKILFSPVGGTDPISENNMHDGAILHICRVYEPDEVNLYMSAEVLKHHKEDNRYLYCLDKLACAQGRKVHYNVIEKPDLHEVQEFDYFYRDFSEIIREITAGMDETDKLILNVSSGSPAMKSGLLVLTTLGEYPYKIIQVATPIKGMNEHTHSENDIETLWELNPDNEENYVNRCREITVPTLSAIKQKEIIKRLIREYDYSAALDIAEEVYASEQPKYELIKLALSRLQLDISTAKSLALKNNIDILPVEGTERIYFEYALSLDIMRKKREYANFVRGITPLLVKQYKPPSRAWET